MILVTAGSPSVATRSANCAGSAESLRVGEVRAEQDAVVADDIGERCDVLFVVRRHRHVAQKISLGRTLMRPPSHGPLRPMPVHLVHDLQQVRDPQRPVLDTEALHVGKPAEQVVQHERGERVHDRAIAVEARPLERRLPVRRRVRLLAPVALENSSL